MKVYSNGEVLEVSGGGTDFTAGDGVSIKDGEISVTTPVRGIFTQEEFDALPEEQRNKGLYVIPDGGGGSGGESVGDVYSTEETRIGIWIDGKPLYRMAFSGKAPDAANKTVQLGEVLNVDKVTSIQGTIENSENFLCLPAISRSLSSSDYLYFSKSLKSLNIALQTSNNVGAPVVAVMEYTKTTDEPTISTAEIVAAYLDGLPAEDLDALAEAAANDARTGEGGTA